MDLWRRGRTDDHASDYAWAHDPGLSYGARDEERLTGKIMLAPYQHAGMEGWHGAEPDGRWTEGAAVFPVSSDPSWSQLRITCVNHHPTPQTVDFTLGADTRREVIEPHEEREMTMPRSEPDGPLNIGCTPVRPRTYGADDDRDLGIFVKSIEFLV
jgi:hypothetical protein